MGYQDLDQYKEGEGKVVIFDADGTLWDSKAAYMHDLEIFKGVLRGVASTDETVLDAGDFDNEADYQLAQDYKSKIDAYLEANPDIKIDANLVRSDDEAERNILEGYSDPTNNDFGMGVDLGAIGVDGKSVQASLFGMYITPVEDRMAKNPPELFDGVMETIIELTQQGYKIAVVTDKPKDAFVKIANQHNIFEYIDVHRCKDDVKLLGENKKPAPDMANSVVNELNIKQRDEERITEERTGKKIPEEEKVSFDNSRALVVGDTHMDVNMAKNAGMKSVAVTCGLQTQECIEKHSNPTVVVEEFSSVHQKIGELFAPGCEAPNQKMTNNSVKNNFSFSPN